MFFDEQKHFHLSTNENIYTLSNMKKLLSLQCTFDQPSEHSDRSGVI